MPEGLQRCKAGARAQWRPHILSPPQCFLWGTGVVASCLGPLSWTGRCCLQPAVLLWCWLCRLHAASHLQGPGPQPREACGLRLNGGVAWTPDGVRTLIPQLVQERRREAMPEGRLLPAGPGMPIINWELGGSS